MHRRAALASSRLGWAEGPPGQTWAPAQKLMSSQTGWCLSHLLKLFLQSTWPPMARVLSPQGDCRSLQKRKELLIYTQDSKLEGRALGNQPASLYKREGRLRHMETPPELRAGEGQSQSTVCLSHGMTLSLESSGLLDPGGTQTFSEGQSSPLSTGPGAAGRQPVHQPTLCTQHAKRGSAPLEESGPVQ